MTWKHMLHTDLNVLPKSADWERPGQQINKFYYKQSDETNLTQSCDDLLQVIDKLGDSIVGYAWGFVCVTIASQVHSYHSVKSSDKCDCVGKGESIYILYIFLLHMYEMSLWLKVLIWTNRIQNCLHVL